MKADWRGRLPSDTTSIVLALALCGALVAIQLFWPPPVGLANTGDFERMMKWGGLEYATLDETERHFAWLNTEFHFGKNPWRVWFGFGSSEAIFVKAAALWAWLLPGERFDLRWLGAVHLAGFLAALGLLLTGWARLVGRSPLWLALGVLLVFCDLGYTIYFHSFYSEPATLIFLLAMVGSGLLLLGSLARPERNQTLPATLLLFCACAGLFVTAKPQNFTLLPLLLLFCVRLWGQPAAHTVRRHWRVVLLAFAVGMIAVALLLARLMPTSMRQANLYNATFNGLLKRSPTPELDLRALDLPEAYAVLAGTNFFYPPNKPFDLQSPAFQSQFFARHSPLRLARFYLFHPARLWLELTATAAQSHTLRLEELGNFTRASGKQAQAQAHRWDGWSRFKQRYWPRSLWVLFGYCVALAVLIGRGYRRADRVGKLAREFGWMLLLMMLAAFVTPVLGDGESDLVKHLFLFNALFDLSLLLGLTHLATRLARR